MKNDLEVRAGPPLETVQRLLEQARLPWSDLETASLQHFFAGYAQGKVVGIVGIEPHGTDCLLRSLVVALSLRGAGLGGRLVAQAEQYARDNGVDHVYLLTNTAQAYFRRLGYRECGRAGAPPSIRGSPEFSTLCPDDAAFMHKRLRP